MKLLLLAFDEGGSESLVCGIFWFRMFMVGIWIIWAVLYSLYLSFGGAFSSVYETYRIPL